jgi:hypothetical protein
MEPGLLLTLVISIGAALISSIVVAANSKKLNQKYKDRKKNK